MNKIIFKIASLVLCSVVAISAQQAEQNLQQVPPQQEPQPQQVQQPQPPQQLPQVQQVQQQIQQPIQPQQVQQPQQQIYPPQQEPQPQQVQQPQPPQQLPQVQQQIQQPIQPQQVQPQQQIYPPQQQAEGGRHIVVRTSGGLIGVSGKNWEESDPGYSFGMGLSWLKELDIAAVTFGLSLVYKKTGSYSIDILKTNTVDGEDSTYKTKVDATEIALEIPALLRFNIFQLYVEAGPQINFAILPELKYLTEKGDKKTVSDSDRNIVDCGIAAGLGFNISKQISIDARYFRGLISDFAEIKEGSLYQITFGVNVMF